MAGGAVAGGALLLRGGISARVEPPAAERWMARTLRGWAIPASAQELANPIPSSARALVEGRAHFADHCASCHANDGSGDTKLGRSLYPRAPDMRLPATQRLTDGELYYIIENGVRLTGMPAWGGGGSPEASWHLVHFIRHLPKLTADEVAEMEALNPKSPDEWRALQGDAEYLEGGAAPPVAPGGHGHEHPR
jgi:mono/diheme cytochrome c family protein